MLARIGRIIYWIACGCAVLFFVPAAMALVSVGLGAQEAWGWALVFGIMGSMIWVLGRLIRYVLE
jgi:hypothetical protein